jgi:hypothetical protein
MPKPKLQTAYIIAFMLGIKIRIIYLSPHSYIQYIHTIINYNSVQ